MPQIGLIARVKAYMPHRATEPMFKLFKAKTTSGMPHEGPGYYAKQDPEKVVFDQQTRFRLESNHWKVATFVTLAVALAAIMTRTPPRAEVRSYGISRDSFDRPVVTQLQEYSASEREVKASLTDLVLRMWTIEPIFTQDIRQSRLVKNLSSVNQQMTGAAVGQFATWLGADKPIPTVTEHPDHSRSVQINATNSAGDQTVVVDFTTTERDSTGKVTETRYLQTFRWQQIAPSTDSSVTNNPFGVYVAFFQYQKE